VIERLLTADAALERGEPDAAERLYRQVADADPRNAIALVGLARVAQARGDAPAARDLAEQALALDPQEAAARRLLDSASGVPAKPPAAAAIPASAAAPPASDRRGGIWGFVRRLFGRR